MTLTAERFGACMQALALSPLPENIAVAVSGGADSMALALLAAEWAAEKGVGLLALTVDHGLRSESALEAEQVGRWLNARGIAHRIVHWQMGAQPQANIQARAREARYALLFDTCRDAGIAHLLTAHHQDDQAETFLIRLQRGSGVDGLSAIAPVTVREGITLLRPLLNVPKTVLIAYMRTQNQEWIEDPSNHALHFTRTHMRGLLPSLERTGISPATLSATAERMARASGYLRQETAKACAACLTLHDAGYIILHLPPFDALHPEIALRVLADIFRLMNNDAYRPRFSELEALRYALPKARTLARCRFIPKKKYMLIVREAARIAPPLALTPGNTTIWDGRFAVTLQYGSSYIIQGMPKQLLESLVKPHPFPHAVMQGLPVLESLETGTALPYMLEAGIKPFFDCQITAFPWRNSGQF